MLIEAGANLNLKTENKTPLQISYDANNLRFADELIKAENGIQSSTWNEKSENIEKQNNADIDVNPNQKTTSTKYKTPLIIACENRYYHKVRLLMKAGADIYKGDGHRTPLALAYQNEHVKIIQLLVKAGADANL